MKLEDIKNIARQDAIINSTDLDDEALKSSSLHHKWLDIIQPEIIELKKCENEFKKIYRSRWLYYSGKSDSSVYEKEGDFNLIVSGKDLTMFIESDEMYLAAKLALDEQKEKVSYIENVMKNIGNRHWNIRNAIEWRKLTQCQV